MKFLVKRYLLEGAQAYFEKAQNIPVLNLVVIVRENSPIEIHWTEKNGSMNWIDDRKDFRGVIRNCPRTDKKNIVYDYESKTNKEAPKTQINSSIFAKIS